MKDPLKKMAADFPGFSTGSDTHSLKGKIDEPFRAAMAGEFEKATQGLDEAIKTNNTNRAEDLLGDIKFNEWWTGVASGFVIGLLMVGFSPKKIARMAQHAGIHPFCDS